MSNPIKSSLNQCVYWCAISIVGLVVENSFILMKQSQKLCAS